MIIRLTSFTFLFLFSISMARGQEGFVSFDDKAGNFPLSASGKSAALYADASDYPGVLRAVKDLQADIQRVTGATPGVITDRAPSGQHVIIVGTLGKNGTIDKLAAEKKLDLSGLRGKWEQYLVQTVDKPFPGVDRALVIAGSDKRGTIFGIYELSRQMGVSPWYWWADVPVKKHNAVYVIPGRHTDGEPAVKYRGIFINDEQPALGGWVRDNYGGFNHNFYEKVFELILRMKGNFLWPAMWGQSFYSDDPLSPKLADEYGVVISTSHHEPMMRAHVEWARAKGGAWNYKTNDSTLREFWREGIRRMGNNESIVTLAMRGDGDEPMSEESNINLLQTIVADQRKILHDVTGKDVSTIPQVWALYKEVQEYYDKGMRVPDDVTLLLCDDNWGDLRKLPKPGEAPRKGGYGIYYHFDYVGGPRNYKWLNTNPLPRVWEQMNLAYEYGANRIWVVNVGDIKPMEYPIQFFLDYAWSPKKWSAANLEQYTQQWAEEQFGKEHASAIAHIMERYTKFNGRRKPELLAPDTYSLTNYNEADRVVDEYNALAKEAEAIYQQLPAGYKDAYYQLVLFPVLACANLNQLKVATGKNLLYAQQGRASANDLAKEVETLFARDGELTNYYNKKMSDGKWDHFADQTHISYTYWQQPDRDVMPEVKTLNLPAVADMGVAIEGSEKWWPEERSEAVLPEFDDFNRQQLYIDIFNRGSTPFDFQVKAAAPVIVSHPQRHVGTEQRIMVQIDWSRTPEGKNKYPITIVGPDKKEIVVYAIAHRHPRVVAGKGFQETNGYISMEAVHFSKAVNSKSIHWEVIPDLGRTLDGVTTLPGNAATEPLSASSPRLEYTFTLADSGRLNVQLYLSPTIDFLNHGGLRYAISIDDETPRVINIHPDNSARAWEKSVADNIITSASQHHVSKGGIHTLKFWRIDPAIVLQKIVIDTGGLRPSYLGPPESYRFK